MGLTPEMLEELGKDFPPESIGKLPKPYQADSRKGQCRECGGYHGLPAVHLDYVGHAGVTHRLNHVDPNWTWEPLAYDEFGNPKLDADKNLWIKLTIGGKTLTAVGDGKNMKERIGDAIRNGAMRFGVALKLWAKEELEDNAIERGDHVDPEAKVPDQPKSLAEHVKDSTPEPVLSPDPAGEPVVTGVSASAADRKAIVAQAQFYGFKSKDDRGSVIAVLSRIAGREISGTADKSITTAEAKEMAERFIEVADELAQEAIAQGLGGVAE